MITTRTRRTAPVVPTADESFWQFARMACFATSNRAKTRAALLDQWSRRHPNAHEEERDAVQRRVDEMLIGG